MTGTAEITTAIRENVLQVPNAALRFTPTASGAAEKSGGGLLDRLLPRPPSHPSSKPAGSLSGTAPQVWVTRAGQPVPLSITAGLTNGRFTEVTGAELSAGMQVITEALGTSQ
jgi:HlyD family secretion protein